MFKVNNNDNRAMSSFCSGVDRVPQHWFQAKFTCSKSLTQEKGLEHVQS